MTIDTNTHKENLLKERARLESDLSSIGKISVPKASDWDAITPELSSELAEEGDVASNMQEFENKNAEVEVLEDQLKDVNDALEKIEKNKYGLCEVCEKEIEEDRLNANPSARTCKLHMN